MTGKIRARNVSAASNVKTGLKIYDGMGSIVFQESRFISNGEDGCCVTNQGRSLKMIYWLGRSQPLVYIFI